jgi:cytochrome c556
MKHLKKIIAGAVATAILATSAIAIAQTAAPAAPAGPKPEQLIKWRQSAFQVIGWNFGRIKTNIDGTYNKEEVIKAANALSGVANAGLGSLFAPGTDKGKGWKDTTVKAEAFTDPKFGEIAGAFVKESTELARIANTGDAAAVKAQFAAVAKTCKGCHDGFRNKD